MVDKQFSTANSTFSNSKTTAGAHIVCPLERESKLSHSGGLGFKGQFYHDFTNSFNNLDCTDCILEQKKVVNIFLIFEFHTIQKSSRLANRYSTSLSLFQEKVRISFLDFSNLLYGKFLTGCVHSYFNEILCLFLRLREAGPAASRIGKKKTRPSLQLVCTKSEEPMS